MKILIANDDGYMAGGLRALVDVMSTFGDVTVAGAGVYMRVGTLCLMLLMGLMGMLILRDSWRSYKIHTYEPTSTNETSRTSQTSPHVHTNADQGATSR